MNKERPPRLAYKFVSIGGEETTVFTCPCCGLPTIAEPGGYEICVICHWEDDDGVGFGPNSCTLEEAQKNFRSQKHMDPEPHDLSTKPRRGEFLDTCISLLIDFKRQEDAKKRGILFAAFLVESEWL
jgi:hypothetical protein